MYDIPQALSCKEISDYLGVFGWILYQRLVSDERVSNVQNTPTGVVPHAVRLPPYRDRRDIASARLTKSQIDFA